MLVRLATRAIGSFVLVLVSAPVFAEPGKPVDYTRDIKGLLSNHCYKCHGPDEGQRQAELRLDLRDEAVKTVIVPGDADASPLAQRIAGDNPDEAMPPADSNLPRLTAEQVALVRQWIAEGANFDQHWSYVAVSRPTLPSVPNPAWTKNEIDFFVAAAHVEHDLQPAVDADRVALIRRLSFDLVGLPPSPGEVAAFVGDGSDGAYDRVVDRLLMSPHFGERLAMLWLDLVRFGDTNGYHADLHRNIYPYRDYVIDAFNDNLPFDRFTREQLAGDLLADATLKQQIASGYNRLNMITTEGGAQAKEYLAKYSADRVRNVSSVWLGSTMGCCECHDHKYDPFKTRDFYSLAAFFGDIKQVGVYENKIQQNPEVKVPSSEQAAELASLDAEIASLGQTLDTQTAELDSAQVAWEAKSKADLTASVAGWGVVTPESVASSGGATLTIQNDGSVLSSGENPVKDNYTIQFATDRQNLTGIRIQALLDPSLFEGGLSRANGNFVVTEVEIEVQEAAATEPKKLAIASPVADHEQAGFPIAQAFDGSPDTGWAVEGHVKKENRTAVLPFSEPIAGGPGTAFTVRLKHESIYTQHNIGRFRLALTSEEKPSLTGQGVIPDEIAAILEIDPTTRTAEQTEAIAQYHRSIAAELAPIRAKLAEVEAARRSLDAAIPSTLVAMSAEPLMIRVLPRGNWLDESGEVVTANVPHFLPQLPADTKPDRLALAEWIVSRDNPLTARVFVNRLWKLYFGAGLATSLEDFGSQGDRPSHPELLDWLASEFVDSGWDVKRVVRLIVMSAAYRQSSAATPELRRQDPANRWLARQGRFRLDAELVRDNALSIAGLLSPKLGGRSVKPYQPEGYWDHCNTFLGKLEYDQDHGEDLYRRGLYTYVKRTFPHPSLIAFDSPSREECTVERPRSSTPLQALVLLNDPTYVEAARVLAERILREGGGATNDRLAWAYRRALGRDPQPDELSVLSALLEKHRADLAVDKPAAELLVKTGEWPVPTDLDQTELAAWTSVARVILNLHETMTRS